MGDEFEAHLIDGFSMATIGMCVAKVAPSIQFKHTSICVIKPQNYCLCQRDLS